MPSLKKVNFGLIALLSSALFLTACGGSSDSDNVTDYTPETPYKGETKPGELTPKIENEIADAVIQTMVLHSLEAAEYADWYLGQDKLDELMEYGSVSNQEISGVCDSGEAIGSGSDSEKSYQLSIKYDNCTNSSDWGSSTPKGTYNGSVTEKSNLVKAGKAEGTLEYNNVTITDVPDEVYKSFSINGRYQGTYIFNDNSDNETYVWKNLAIIVDKQEVTASGKTEYTWDGDVETDLVEELYSTVIDGKTYQLQSTSTDSYGSGTTEKVETTFYHPDHGQFTIEATILLNSTCENNKNLNHSTLFLLTDEQGNELNIEGNGCDTPPSVDITPAAQ